MEKHLVLIREAIAERELASLTAAVEALAKRGGKGFAHQQIHRHIVPTLSPSEIEWFWGSITTPVQSERVCDLIIKDAVLILTKQGYVIGRDFSIGYGEKRLLLGKAACDCLEQTLTTTKKVMLSLVTKQRHT
jgi:hypothetical protein